MVKVRKINHLVLRVRDVERTIRFYRDVLGMEVVGRVGPGGNAGVFFKFTDNHHDLACFALGPEAEGPCEDQVGMYHVALEVGTLEELVAARDELARAGALVGMSDHGVSKSLYVKDPDGNELEVLWNVPRAEWKDLSVMGTRPLNLEAELAKYKECLLMSENSPFSGINHLAMVTGDMDKTVRFYRDVLGCKLVATIGTDRFKHYFFSIGHHNTIAFFEWPGIDPGVPEKPAGMPEAGRQFDHMSFNVDSYEDLLALQKRLRESGVEVTRIVDHQFIHSIYFDDPNGIALEASVWLMDPEKEVAYHDPDPVASVREKPVPGPQAEPRKLQGEVLREAVAAGLKPPDGPKPAPV